MDRVAKFIQTRSGISSQEKAGLNQIRDQLWKRLADFLKMRSQTENDTNPFADKRKTPSVLFCYILWCIAELPAKDAAIMQQLTPELRIEYHQEGDWQNIVAAVMGFDDDWRSQLLKLWERNSEVACSCGVPLTPREFAEQVIERNFGLSLAFGSGSTHSCPS